LKGLLRVEPDVGMGELEWLKPVIDLHRGLHPLEVVPVTWQDRDQEDHSVDHVPGDAHDLAGVFAAEFGGLPVELKVAGTAVDHAARGAARPPAVVLLLEQQHGSAPPGQVARHPGAGHPSPADDDVVSARRAHKLLTLWTRAPSARFRSGAWRGAAASPRGVKNVLQRCPDLASWNAGRVRTSRVPIRAPARGRSA